MTREEFEKYTIETYNCIFDNPWVDAPNYRVYRHPSTAKWFAVAMNIPKCKLGIKAKGNIDIVNMKCDPVMVSNLTGQKGFYPAWHMSKEKWITAALDGSADDDTIKMLIDISYDLTKPKIRAKKKEKKDD